ncbi:hypothetical protein F2Q68_00018999 [Brassica cretica]|uniref:Uncharacterized protein n=1 Tax=Brassica cretica TaxID=69181 RepID=A0A8S9FUB6_BRACR|nr:hypothetical protein F2Q68_00018999 [Brassica cretica]
MDVPIISLSNPRASGSCGGHIEEWGIFQIHQSRSRSQARILKNLLVELTGPKRGSITPWLSCLSLLPLHQVGTEFFELSETEKEVIAKPEDSMDVEGYRTKFKKDLDAWVDHLFHRIRPPSRVSYCIWPKNPKYRSRSMEFSN